MSHMWLILSQSTEGATDMTYQVKWVSANSRYTTYTTLSFVTLEEAQEARNRHYEETGRPAWIVTVKS